MVGSRDYFGAQFYRRDPRLVAIDLLGLIIVRRLGSSVLKCVVTEVEAYYGEEDPASRARRGGRIRERLYGEQGTALIYGMHRQWLFNVVAHENGRAGAVLIRSCEPLEGLDVMARLRGVPPSDPTITIGPGRLTRALGIDKSLDGVRVYSSDSPLIIMGPRLYTSLKLASSGRIGVTRDLPVPLRFYIANSRYVSRPRGNYVRRLRD
jgi:DNA-3-methyladenine glycosylase